MKSVIIYSLLLTVFFTVIGYLYVQEYSFQKSEIEKDIESAFKESLDQDFEIRFAKSKLTYYAKVDPPALPISHQIVRQTSEGVTVIPYSKSLYNSTFEEKTRRVFQDVLRRKVPIEAYQVDSLLQINLLKKNIQGETNVGVFTEKDESYCRKKERINSSYYASEIVSLDPFDKLRVQAFVNYDVMTMLKRMYVVCAIGGIVCLAAIIILFELIRRYRRGEHLLFQKTKRLAPKANDPAEADPIRRLENGHYRIGNALFVYELCHLRNEMTGNEVFIVPQLANVLALFLNAPDHYLRASEIAEKLWPHKSMSVHEVAVQVGKVISKLRGELRKVADIEIEKKNVIYVLKLVESDNKKITLFDNGFYQLGNYYFDPMQSNLYIYGASVPLTVLQASILKFFLAAPGGYVSNKQLAEVIALNDPEPIKNSEGADIDRSEFLQPVIEALGDVFSRDTAIEFVSDGAGYRLLLNEEATE